MKKAESRQSDMMFKGSEKDKPGEERVTEESENSSIHSDAAAEKQVLRKVDWHILPMVFLYYMISFLDR